MGQFMTQTNIGVCLSPLDIVGDSFYIEAPGILSWFMAGYSLTVGTFILAGAAIYSVIVEYSSSDSARLRSGLLLQVSASTRTIYSSSLHVFSKASVAHC